MLVSALRWLIKFPAQLMVWTLRGYQKFISPLTGPRCKYYPTCSEYALRAFRVHGFFKGYILSIWRLLRCNPYSNGGVDHVPLPGQWHNPWTHPGSITEESYRTPNPNLPSSARDEEPASPGAPQGKSKKAQAA